MAKYLHIDLDLTERLGLYGTEAMVFSALQYLCRSGEWKGSYSELAKWAGLASKQEAHYVFNKLVKKGISTSNILTKSSNIFTLSSKITPKSKEERTKEENINKYNKGGCGSNNDRPHTRETPTPPTYEEFYNFGISKDISISTIIKAWSYYSIHDWDNVKNWKAALYYWDLKNKDQQTPPRSFYHQY